MNRSEYFSGLVNRAADSAIGISAEVRRIAAGAFVEVGLPSYNDEDYQRTDPEALLPEGLILLQGAFRADIPADKTIFVGSLDQAPPEAALRYVVQKNTDAFSHLAIALSETPTVVYIPDNYEGTESLSLEHLYAEANIPALHAASLLIVAGRNSRAEILLSDSAGYRAGDTLLRHCQVIAEANSRLRIRDLEYGGEFGRRITSTYLDLFSDAYVDYVSSTTAAGETRNNFYARLNESGAELKIGGIALVTGERKIDNFCLVHHLAPRCNTDELFKYVLSGSGSGVFSGRIYVDRIAQKTVAYQRNCNLLLSPTAKMYTKPQLEIYADDVKCSHGMTTGRLDEEALFYMRTRGIPEGEARRLLTLAFLGEVVESVTSRELREKLRDQIANEL